MKNLYVYFVLIVVGDLKAQNFLMPLKSDSMHLQFWNSITGALDYDAFSRLRYNSGDQVDTEFVQETYLGLNQTTFYRCKNLYGTSGELLNYVWLSNQVSWNGPWVNFKKRDNEYDTQGRLKHYLEQIGNNADWDYFNQESFWFDDVTRMDSSIQQEYDSAGSMWINVVKRTNALNTNGDLKLSTYSNWSAALNIWPPGTNCYFTYYPNGNLKTKKYVTYTNGGTIGYDYSIKVDSSLYNAAGKLDSVFYTTNFYPTGDSINEIDTYEYDLSGSLSSITTVKRNNNTGTWNPVVRSLYQPGDGVYSNDFSSVTHQGFNSTSLSWVSYGKDSISFYPQNNNRVLEVELAYWESSGDTLQIQYIDSTWYHISSVGTNSPGNKFVDCTFTNPYTPGSPVVCNADDATAPLQLRLTDLVGRPVAQARAMPGEAWTPPANLGTGLYVLQVWQNGRQLGARKMIIP